MPIEEFSLTETPIAREEFCAMTNMNWSQFDKCKMSGLITLSCVPFGRYDEKFRFANFYDLLSFRIARDFLPSCLGAHDRVALADEIVDIIAGHFEQVAAHEDIYISARHIFETISDIEVPTINLCRSPLTCQNSHLNNVSAAAIQDLCRQCFDAFCRILQVSRTHVVPYSGVGIKIDFPSEHDN